jgi:hypothetical protein
MMLNHVTRQPRIRGPVASLLLARCQNSPCRQRRIHESAPGLAGHPGRPPAPAMAIEAGPPPDLARSPRGRPGGQNGDFSCRCKVPRARFAPGFVEFPLDFWQKYSGKMLFLLILCGKNNGGNEGALAPVGCVALGPIQVPLVWPSCWPQPWLRRGWGLCYHPFWKCLTSEPLAKRLVLSGLGALLGPAGRP